MKNHHTLLLVICALLLGVNIGLLLSQPNAAPVSILSTAQAGTPILSSRENKIFTASEDGTKLYEWQPQSAGTNSPNPWVAIEHHL